jgi:uncharacterized membrane protein YfcA
MSASLVWVYLAFGAACFITGLSKGGLGGALGFIITPMLALVMPLNRAVGLMLPILILADTFTLAAYWKRWEAKRIRVLLIGAVVGVSLATLVLSSFPLPVLKRCLGVLVLIFAAYKLAEPRLLAGLAYQTRAWHAVLAGWLAGFTSTLAHAGGPPITMYLLLQKLEPTVFIATSGLFFCLLNWIKVPYYAAAGMFDWQWQLRLAWLALLVPVGVFTGRKLAKHINRARFEQAVLALLALSGVLLLR